MDYQDLIFSHDFNEYRKEQLTVIVNLILQILKEGINHDAKAERLAGVLELSAQIIKLPSKLIKNEKQVERLNKMITEDLTNISSFLVRERLKEIG